MAMENGGLSASDVMALTRDNDGLFGGGAGGILALIIVFILLFGNGGYGGGFGRYGGEQYATSNEVQRGFDNQNVTNKLDGITYGICESGYANAQLINGVEKTVMQSANDVNAGITALGYQFQNCCCENQRLSDKNTRDILEAICADGQATRALITDNEITRLRNDLQSAQLTLANVSQTQNILNSLGRFVTNPPCYGGMYQYGYGATIA